MVAVSDNQTAAQLVADMLRDCRPRKLRTMREFAEQEIVLPDGPFEGQRFAVWRQPVSGPALDAMSDPQWRKIVGTGPVQGGKTLNFCVIPIMYHLFEVGETVIWGVPDLNMAADKWTEDLLPAILASRYADLLPRKGGGARGGRQITSVQFRNGATLRFMTAGGGDKGRAGFTSRVVVITEVDGFAKSAESSAETDKVSQLEARTAAFGPRRRIYLECTVTTKDGRIWREYEGGTASKFVMPCPHCDEHVLPEREQLVGWKDADTVIDAENNTRIACPDCGAVWSEDERKTAAQSVRLEHEPDKQTDTLSMRYHSAHNLIVPIGAVGVEEWRAARTIVQEAREEQERKLRQYYWTTPYTQTIEEHAGLEVELLAARAVGDLDRAVVPSWADGITVGCDVGKRLLHWCAVAFRRDNGSAHVVEYGRTEVPSETLGVERAIANALRELRDRCDRGWLVPGVADARVPVRVWVDSGYQTDSVDLVTDERDTWASCKGFSGGARYRTPQKLNSNIRKIGDGWHLSLLRRKGRTRRVVHVNADRWKAWTHARLVTPVDKPGAMTLFAGTRAEHTSFLSHLTAEVQVRKWRRGQEVVTWEQRGARNNHWLDAVALAGAAASSVGLTGSVPGDPKSAGQVEKPRARRARSGRRKRAG